MKSLSRLFAGLIAATLLIGAAPPTHKAQWVILGDPAGERTISFKETTAENFARIIPNILMRLDGDVALAGGKFRIPKGTLLVGVDGGTRLACEMIRRSGNESIGCLQDTDDDGAFDSGWKMRTGSEFLLNAFIAPAATKLPAPVKATTLDPRKDSPEVHIELFFENRAEWVKLNDLKVCIQRRDLKTIWGGVMPLRVCLGQGIRIKDKEYPYTLRMFGGSVVFLSGRGDIMQTRMNPPLEDRPM
jgi:hypothetical protein